MEQEQATIDGLMKLVAEVEEGRADMIDGLCSPRFYEGKERRDKARLAVRAYAHRLQQPCPASVTDPVRAALEELVSCHFAVTEHHDPEEEARRTHARQAAAWRKALEALGVYRAIAEGDTSWRLKSAMVGPASVEGWIPVDERLPEVGTEVLLWAEVHPHAVELAEEDERKPPASEVHMGQCRDGLGGAYLDDYAAPDDDRYVTHWMPLPAPPLSAPSSRGTEAQAEPLPRAEVLQIEDGRWTVVRPANGGKGVRRTYCCAGDEGQAEAQELADFWNEGADCAALRTRLSSTAGDGNA